MSYPEWVESVKTVLGVHVPALVAEVEKLQRRWEGLETVVLKQDAEIERLRAALEEFANPANWYLETGMLGWQGKPGPYLRARRALDELKDGDK